MTYELIERQSIVLGSGRYTYRCTIWNNAVQSRTTAELSVDVPSRTALNALLSREGFGEWKVTHHELVQAGTVAA